MNIEELTFTTADLAKAISAVDFNSVTRHSYEEYSLLFGRQLEHAADLSNALQFLSIVCSFRLRPDDEHSPLESIWLPSAIDNISDTQLSALSDLDTETYLPELRARFADLVWLRKRSHTHARVAALSYLATVEQLVNSNEALGVRERLKRAVQLASQIGRNDDLHSQIIERITAIAELDAPHHCTLAVALDVLADSKSADSARLHRRAANLAHSINTSQPNPLWERRFWLLASRFAAQNKDEPASHAALVEAALTWEREAQAAPMQAVAAHFWEMALQTYRRIPGTEQQRERVHQELLKAQSHVPKEMIPLHTESVDISELVTIARGRVYGKDKFTALAELILATHWEPKARLRAQAEEAINRYPLQHLFSTVRFSSTWKVAATASGAGGPDSIAPDRLHAEMCQHFRYFVPFAASGTIEPMRQEIILSHNVALHDVAEIVHNSPAVPLGRDAFFIIGLHAGIHGRYLEALHVLIPQLEHMLRVLLAAKGAVTSRINNMGIQEEFDLNRILVMPEAESLLGEDLCFALRVVFTERYGYNLRNEVMHGMVMPGTFYSDSAIYAWWIIAWLVGQSVATAILNQGTENAEDAA